MTSNVCPGCKTVLENTDAKFCSECGWDLAKSLFGQHSSVATKTAGRSISRRYHNSRVSRWISPLLATVRRGLIVARMWLRKKLGGLWIWVGISLLLTTLLFNAYGWSVASYVSGASLILWTVIWYWTKAPSPKKNGETASATNAGDVFVVFCVCLFTFAAMGMPIEFDFPPFSGRRRSPEEMKALQKFVTKHTPNNAPALPPQSATRAKAAQLQKKEANRAKATLQYWDANVAMLHTMRFGEIPDSDLETLMAVIKSEILRTKLFHSLTDNVDPELVEMCRRHIELDESGIRLYEDILRRLEEDGLSAPTGSGRNNAQHFFDRLAGMSDEEWDRLPENAKVVIGKLEAYMDKNEERLREIDRMQGRLSERYSSAGVEFPLPELNEQTNTAPVPGATQE